MSWQPVISDESVANSGRMQVRNIKNENINYLVVYT
jgi:hypothetical protein